MLLLPRQLSLHNPFACHPLYFFNQPPSSVQSLNIIATANTPATDEYIWYRPPSGALGKSIL